MFPVALALVVGSAAWFVASYFSVGRAVSRFFLRLDDSRQTAAVVHSDGKEFSPTPWPIVLGNHFVSIAGTGPIVGPSIALFWGWAPAVLWVLLGSSLLGGVHDLCALVISVRAGGKSIGDSASMLIGPRVRTPYLALVLLTNLLVIAIFVSIVGSLLQLFPSAIFPLWGQIPLAAALGWFLRVKPKWAPPWASSLVALAAAFALVVVGAMLPFPETLPANAGPVPMLVVWTVSLLAYAYAASVTPVWVLSQSRNVLNGAILALVLAALAACSVIRTPPAAAPIFARHAQPSSGSVADVELSPPVAPFIFSTISCGALSGFHSLVCAGTTSKQVAKETNCVPIAYGAMLGEGFLAVVVIVSITCGLSQEAWRSAYNSWSSVQGLGASLRAFVQGAAAVSSPIDLVISEKIRKCAIGFLVSAFASTTLDATVRIQRYALAELVERAPRRLKIIGSRHIATLIVVASGGALALAGAQVSAMLWPVFGALNQLLASFTLLVAACSFPRASVLFSVLAAVAFLIGASAISANIWMIAMGPLRNIWLAFLAVVLAAVVIWMLSEAILSLFRRVRKQQDSTSESEIALTSITASAPAAERS